MRQLPVYIILWIYTLFMAIPCKSQPYVTYVPEYMDMKVTACLMDSLQQTGINTFIIYQTNINRKEVIDSTLTNNDTIPVSYLIWGENGKTMIILITNSCIFCNTNAMYSSSIFSYPNFNKLWLRKDEDVYRFVCPFNSPYKKDIVVYIRSKKNTLFFEIGENISYQLKPSRNKYRNEFIEQLKCLLLKSNSKWMKISDYNRIATYRLAE